VLPPVELPSAWELPPVFDAEPPEPESVVSPSPPPQALIASRAERSTRALRMEIFLRREGVFVSGKRDAGWIDGLVMRLLPLQKEILPKARDVDVLEPRYERPASVRRCLHRLLEKASVGRPTAHIHSNGHTSRDS
jgi:hypothetical protein